MLLLLAPGPAHGVEDMTAELVRFIVGHTRARTTECSEEIRERELDKPVICATYSARWSSFKSDWDFVLGRFDLPVTTEARSAWTKTEGRYERLYRVEKSDLTVTFDERRALIVFAYTLEGSGDAAATPAGATGSERAPRGTGSTVRMAGFGGVTTPRLLADGRVEPVYPKPAAEQGIEGSVALQAMILEDGTVGELKILSARPEGWGFGEAALAAVRHWLYEPARYKGLPVDATFTIYVSFGPPAPPDEPGP